MFRLRSSVAAGLIAVITISAFVPGLCSLEAALFEPLWILVPDAALARADDSVAVCREQPLPLFSLSLSRAPPSAL